MFSKRRLNGIEQLERKDLFAGVMDAPKLSPEPMGDEQTSLTPMADHSYAGLMENPVADLTGPGSAADDDQTSLSPAPYPDGQTSFAASAEICPGAGECDGQTSLMPTPPPDGQTSLSPLAQICPGGGGGGGDHNGNQSSFAPEANIAGGGMAGDYQTSLTSGGGAAQLMGMSDPEGDNQTSP